MCDVTVTSYVTTNTSLLINYMPHKQNCIGVCDVTAEVTCTGTSLIGVYLMSLIFEVAKPASKTLNTHDWTIVDIEELAIRLND